MEYGAIIWNPYTKKETDQLERLQRMAVRFINKDYKSRDDEGTTRRPTKKNIFYRVVEGQVPAM